jgi:hypothetical protein
MIDYILNFMIMILYANKFINPKTRNKKVHLRN